MILPIIDDVPIIKWLLTVFGYIFIVIFLSGSFYLTIKTAIKLYRKQKIALSAGLIFWYITFPVGMFMTIHYRDELTEPFKILVSIIIGILLPTWILTGYLVWSLNRNKDNNVPREG
ncbi:hypothetical protein ETC05_16545 [Geobacillus sp. BMUD]|uniref:hypothetical protein n=1 Tax=Geobacillus sp. BMUD TaxID=2508876 RepID=UPI0014927113|nr:hypothetical protein [Geobacillus sp. BMUD]NNU85348.1 hypothetical protein [Geobacillus sp. BMUD]